MSDSILVIAHSDWRQGRLAPLLEAKGYRVQWCCPAGGECLPTNGVAYAGAVVLGGVQSANEVDSKAYLAQEMDWMRCEAAQGRRLLGICLGAQLLARALGAEVSPHAEGINEIGYFPVFPTPAGSEVIPAGLHVYHWHKEGFELPGQAELLARGEAFPHQAFRLNPKVYGLQFHPEVTASVASAWVESAADHLTRPGAQPASRQLDLARRFDAPLHDWFDGFLDRWLDRVPGAS
jgi:GMP synthase (glutamine-hydrolysing)